MKKVISIVICVLFLMQSCTTSVYRDYPNNGDFSKIQTGRVYTVYVKGQVKKKMRVTEIEQESITGIIESQKVTLAKKDIRAVKKSNPAGTVAIVLVGVVGMTGLVAAMVALINGSQKTTYYNTYY